MQRRHSRFRLICVAFVMFAMNGCGSTPVQLDRQRVADRPISRIDLLTPQETLENEKSAAGFDTGVNVFAVLGAVVGSAIDAAVNASRRKSFETIKVGAASTDLNAYFKDQLSLGTKGDAFSDSVSVNPVDDDIVGPDVPLLTLRYYISENFRFVVVAADVSYRQSEATNRTYTRTYSSIQTIDDIDALSDDKSENIEFWAKNITLLVSLVEEGMSDVVRKFVRDFSG